MSTESFLNSLSSFLKNCFSTSTQKDLSQAISPPSQASTPPLLLSDQVLCYVGIASGRRNTPYILQQLFRGDLDQYLTTRYFQAHYHIFSKALLRNAANLTAHRTTGKNTVYVLAMKFSPGEVKKMAAEGRFSEGILCAYPAEELAQALMYKEDLSKLEPLKPELTTSTTTNSI
jgi:hypothetical protein